MRIAWAVLLSALLGPGAGQLYNRQYKKGTYLIGMSFFVLIAFFVWIFKAILPLLPPDLTVITPEALKPMIETAVKQVATTYRGTFLTYQFILTSLWIYSIVDAFRYGWRRRLKA